MCGLQWDMSKKIQRMNSETNKYKHITYYII